MGCKPLSEENMKMLHEQFGHLWPDEDRLWEKNVREEARNIALNQPLFPGDTISHRTAKECARRGWAKRNENGDWIATELCPFTATRPIADVAQEE